MKLEVVDLQKSFDNKEILKNINFTFEQGKIYGLLGRNGAGKSTLLKSFVDTSLLEEGIGEDKFSITILDHPIIGFLKQNDLYL